MLKIKTKYGSLLIFVLIISKINAQQIYIETGLENAYFKNYINNLGENTLDLNYSKPLAFFLEGGVKFNVYNDRLKWDIGASYNQYRINTGFYLGNESIPLTYDLTYVSLKTGFNYAIINDPLFKLQVHTHLSYDWLTTGKSKYRDVVNNLLLDNTFDTTLLRYHRGISAEYFISDSVSSYINYNVADSFREKNQDSNIEEIYTYHTSAFSIGLLFSLANPRNKCYGGF